MIRDNQRRSEITQDWTAVMKLCTESHRSRILPNGSFLSDPPPEFFFNLPFVLAYAVLDQALGELIDQGTIHGPRNRALLGEKMAASVNVLPWQDYAVVDAGKRARNELAHEAKLLSNATCIAYINAVGNELRAWGIT